MKKFKIIIVIFIILLNITIPVLADDHDDIEDIDLQEIVETGAETTNIPVINSRAAVIYDRTSGQVIYGKNENVQKKMASTTKIMTCIVVLENANLNDVVEVSAKSAGTGGSRLGLTKGSKITVNDLLYGLMLCSGNDAAVALAEHVAGSVSEFSVLMNKKAETLGLKNTHFVTPHGLDEEEHYTTAYELAKITDYALNVEKFAEIVRTKYYTVTINENSKNLSNTNELLGNLNGVYGVKTGFTNGANRCLVSAIKRDDLDIICVVLGADTKKIRTQDSIKLIEYTFKNYKLINLSDIIEKEFVEWKKQNIKKVTVIKGKEEYSNLVINTEGISYYPLNNRDIDNIEVVIDTEDTLNAPVYKNQIVGKIILKIDGKEIEKIDIVNEKEINQKKYIDYFIELLTNFTIYLEKIH